MSLTHLGPSGVTVPNCRCFPDVSSQPPSTASSVLRRGSKPRPSVSHPYALRSLSHNNLVSETMASSGAPAAAAASSVAAVVETSAPPPSPTPPTLEDSLAALAAMQRQMGDMFQGMQRQMAEMSLRLATVEGQPGPSMTPCLSYSTPPLLQYGMSGYGGFPASQPVVSEILPSPSMPGSTAPRLETAPPCVTSQPATTGLPIQ